jgi:hypothetical protein
MPHQRQVIREAAQAALVAANTAAGTRVTETRLGPQRATELPAISVYTLSEEVDPASAQSAPRELKRELQLAVEGWVRATGNVDDALDALALEIERAMHADPTLGGACSDSVLASTEVGIKMDGDRPMGAVHIVYVVRFYTYVPEADDVTLDDLSTVDVKTSLANAVNEANQAEDLIENLED